MIRINEKNKMYITTNQSVYFDKLNHTLVVSCERVNVLLVIFMINDFLYFLPPIMYNINFLQQKILTSTPFLYRLSHCFEFLSTKQKSLF